MGYLEFLVHFYPINTARVVFSSDLNMDPLNLYPNNNNESVKHNFFYHLASRQSRTMPLMTFTPCNGLNCGIMTFRYTCFASISLQLSSTTYISPSQSLHYELMEPVLDTLLHLDIHGQMWDEYFMFFF